MTNPWLGLFKTIFMLLFRRAVFERDAIGKKLLMDDGRAFTVFRRAVIKSKQPEPAAWFLVRFLPLHMTSEQNIRFSILPMLVFMGFKGFRTKYWAVDYQTGLCQGLYEWQTVADAENYARSIAMKFMTKRSDPDSVMFRIVDKAQEDFEYKIVEA